MSGGFRSRCDHFHKCKDRSSSCPVCNLGEGTIERKPFGGPRHLFKCLNIFCAGLLTFKDLTKQRCRLYPQHAGDLMKAARSDTVGAFFIFLYLLECNADLVCEIGLRKTKEFTSFLNPCADLDIHGFNIFRACHLTLAFVDIRSR
ncbi:hypothetical protein ASG19_23070 [Rhizobium sp. Leaf306]|nr:hypothetical protein ASG19_23070 [Rhizobium sp. Leaf306]KQQ77985.1 hypothetical protein ASF70_01775 [Rhizobium sp. Leaf321]